MRVRVTFFWRDCWLGFYLSDEESKLVVCIVPMFPVIIEWGAKTSLSDSQK